jgi:hypothetical protein
MHIVAVIEPRNKNIVKTFGGIESNSYLCKKKQHNNKNMPEVFRFYGFSFFFFSREHEPLHVHVEGNGGMAKFIWNGTEFVLFEKEGIKTNDYRKIKHAIDENADIIINRWNEYFNK